MTGLALLGVLAVGLAPIDSGVAPLPRAEEEVRSVVLAFADAWTHAERPEDIAAYYAVDATHINPQGEWVRGRSELVPYFEPLVAGRAEDFDAVFDIERISFVGDAALVDGSITIRGMRGRDGKVIPRLFERFAFVMHKSDGTWQIHASRVMFPD